MILSKLQTCKKGEVVALKLNSGLMIIGQTVEVNCGAATITLEKVREMNLRPVQRSPNEPPQMTVDMNMPYVFLDQDCEVFVMFQDIQAVPLVPAELDKHYLSSVSGIELPR